MALRSLGSSLVAKAGIGGKYRDVAEANIQGQPTDQGKVGSLSRNQIEEPLNRSVSPGSNKVVASKPIVEAAFGEQPSDFSNPATGLPATPSMIPGIGLGPVAPNPVVGANPIPFLPPTAPTAPNAPAPSVEQSAQPRQPSSPTGDVLGTSFQAAPSRPIAPRLPTAAGVTGGRAIVDRGPLRSRGGNQLRSGSFA